MIHATAPLIAHLRISSNGTFDRQIYPFDQ